MSDDTTPPASLSFSIQKANHFRVIYADGILGGLTPRGMLEIGFFNERLPFPTQMEFAVNEDGRVAGELTDRRVARESIIRELDVAVTMNYETARAFKDWLDQRVDEMGEIQKMKRARE